MFSPQSWSCCVPEQEYFCACQASSVWCVWYRERACGSDADRLQLWDRTYCVCTNTAHPVWEEVPSDGAPQIRPLHSRRLFASTDTPPSAPFYSFSSLLFNNPGNLNRWKPASEPAASTQTEVLSCMVIRPSRENGSVLFSAETPASLLLLLTKTCLDTCWEHSKD